MDGIGKEREMVEVVANKMEGERRLIEKMKAWRYTVKGHVKGAEIKKATNMNHYQLSAQKVKKAREREKRGTLSGAETINNTKCVAYYCLYIQKLAYNLGRNLCDVLRYYKELKQGFKT